MFEDLDLSIIRSKKRKTVGFKIEPQNKIIITFPEEVSQEFIDRTLKKKVTWIYQQLKKTNLINIPEREKEFVNGESFSFLGEEYRLKLLPDSYGEGYLSDGYICIPSLNSTKIEIYNKLESFYKREALLKIRERVSYWSNKIGLTPKSIDIKNFKKSWGICSPEGDISINWKLIMAPIRIMDYVIIHELAHLEELNHSKDFWNLIRSLIPNYCENKEWLKINGSLLNI